MWCIGSPMIWENDDNFGDLEYGRFEVLSMKVKVFSRIVIAKKDPQKYTVYQAIYQSIHRFLKCFFNTSQ